MQGYQLTFYTEQDRKHGSLPLGDWLVEEARKLGAGSAALIATTEGFGPDHKLRSAHFFELADQPIAVGMAISAEGAERLFQTLHDEKINVFYIKTAIDFGMTSDS